MSKAKDKGKADKKPSQGDKKASDAVTDSPKKSARSEAKESKEKDGARLKHCVCTKHPKSGVTTAAEQQDRMYGRGMRVFNIGKGTSRCTVCGEKK